MGRISKLLDKQFKAFTTYALVVLVCSIPAYFFIVEHIWMSELDEHNKIIAIQNQSGLDSLSLSEKEIAGMLRLWNKTRPGSTIIEAEQKKVRPDSTYEISRQVTFDSGTESDRFRGLVTYVYIQKTPYRLTVETNVEESNETFVAIAVVTVVFFFALIAGFVLLNRKLSAKIWKPFNETLHKLRSFDLNSKETLTLAPSDITEFDDLNRVLLKLIEKNSSLYQAQKEFTENASHELQTPLAIIQSKLDLLMQTKGLTQEQFGLIDQVNKTLSRISHLNKNLLLLTKIENDQFSDLEVVNLSDLSEETTHLLADVIHGKGLVIETSVTPNISVTANRTLVQILISNLLSNAIRHTIIPGNILLTLSSVGLLVSNSGNTSLDSNMLYERFMSVDASGSGSGLGLAIVQQICHRYGWSIKYTFKNDQHCFSVSF